MTRMQLELDSPRHDDFGREQQTSAGGAEVLNHTVYKLFTHVNFSWKIHFNTRIQPTVTFANWHPCLSPLDD